MEDKAVLERISGLKGRLGYEEKKAKKLGFGKDFTIYDTSDAETVIKQILQELNYDLF